MTEPLDLTMPRSCVLSFRDQVDYRRPDPLVGTLDVPAGVTMVEILWTGDARLIVATPSATGGTLVNAWQYGMSAPPSGEYPYFHIVSSAPTALMLQGLSISAADLEREMAVNLIPIAAD